MRNEYLSDQAINFVRSNTAADLAAGLTACKDDFEMIHDLGLTWQGNNVTNDLTALSRERLSKLIADPDQRVCSADECDCDKIHVEGLATRARHIIKVVTYPGEQYYHLLPHKMCPSLIIFADRDGQWAEYRVSDPTKSPAWDYNIEVDLNEARRIAGLEVA